MTLGTKQVARTWTGALEWRPPATFVASPAPHRRHRAHRCPRRLAAAAVTASIASAALATAAFTAATKPDPTEPSAAPSGFKGPTEHIAAAAAVPTGRQTRVSHL